MSLDQRLYSFLFDPAAGVQMEIVRSLFAEQEQPWLASATEPQWRQLARQKINTQSPIAEIDLPDLMSNSTHKLALLTVTEWRLLGLGVALLPFVGRIARSMDGNFRRGIRTILKEPDIEALDNLANDEEIFETRPQFMAPSIVWKNMEFVHAGGIQAIVTQVCKWPAPIDQRTSWKFVSVKEPIGPLVADLTSQHIEALCKILLPSHPWLLSSSQTH